MALTDAEKKKIEEEEGYRAEIRKESKQTSKKGCSGCLIAILIIIVFFVITFIAINPAKQFEQAEQHSISTPTLDITANVGKHAYNKISGAYQGEILEVKPCNTTSELTCFVVNQPSFMRPIEVPVDNSVVKDISPTPTKQPL
jgi:hypothetical protein